ncbi:uncharacterized protein CLAFUR5_13848 [Fulvia fulva]|uniref:Uncharacterized protein n=1 Tax=Passalora fulva TaxID=5499 RepID=A0A9Q8PLE0_PASFU|nr:uncharacterized protein CLAFUR5_13848 [Fulvia fulva]UJO24529.1 hypothetical protein CLAFUR5_13848 [Fulvia fulva]WPV36998.1 hypothetical protein CLAFUW7_14019 [Fulvia fulva]
MVYLRSQAIAAREIAAKPATECHFSKIPPESRVEIYKLTLTGVTDDLEKLKRPQLLNVCQRIQVESLDIYRKEVTDALQESKTTRDEMWKAFKSFVGSVRGRSAAECRYHVARLDHKKSQEIAEKELRWIEEEMEKLD